MKRCGEDVCVYVCMRRCVRACACVCGRKQTPLLLTCTVLCCNHQPVEHTRWDLQPCSYLIEPEVTDKKTKTLKIELKKFTHWIIQTDRKMKEMLVCVLVFIIQSSILSRQKKGNDFSHDISTCVCVFNYLVWKGWRWSSHCLKQYL